MLYSYLILLKFSMSILLPVNLSKVAWWMANILWHLIWVYTACSGLSVRIRWNRIPHKILNHLLSWIYLCIESFHPCRPIQIPLQTVQIRMRPLIIYAVCHAVILFWLKTICNNGCVQIQRWYGQFQKLEGDRVKYYLTRLLENKYHNYILNIFFSMICSTFQP